MGEQALAAEEIVAFVDAFEPAEAADYLARLDSQLIDMLCRPGVESEQGVAQGLAYWLLKGALERRAADGARDD